MYEVLIRECSRFFDFGVDILPIKGQKQTDVFSKSRGRQIENVQYLFYLIGALWRGLWKQVFWFSGGGKQTKAKCRISAKIKVFTG